MDQNTPVSKLYYSSVAESDRKDKLPFRLTEIGEFSGKKLSEQIDLGEVDLDEINLDSKVLEKRIVEAFTKKRFGEIGQSAKAIPFINVKEKTCGLPKTFAIKEDNIVGTTMLLLCKSLGFKVQLLDYGERQYDALSERDFKFAAGISFVILDYGVKFRIEDKESPYEEGRTYARSQQIVGMFESNKKLGLDALKRKHRWFGNNPGETSGVGKSRVVVDYLGKNIESIFAEVEWKTQLRFILNALLRFSWIFLETEVLESALRDNVLQFSEIITLYGTRKTVITPSQGRRQAVTADRVPKKPKNSSLLIKEEMTLIDKIISPLFAAVEGTDKDSFISVVLTHGFTAIKRKVIVNSTHRSEFLQKFASMTTKRLTSIRKVGGEVSKRKRDITSSEVIIMLSRRDDPVSEFATELISLDPNFERFLMKFRRGATEDPASIINYEASKTSLIDYLRADCHLYENVIISLEGTDHKISLSKSYQLRQEELEATLEKVKKEKGGEHGFVYSTLRAAYDSGTQLEPALVLKAANELAKFTGSTQFKKSQPSALASAATGVLRKCGILLPAGKFLTAELYIQK